MPVLMFSPRFVPLVESREKLQTIRPPRKRPVKPGDRLSLRAWRGDAYRSPQRVLCEAECLWVGPVAAWLEPLSDRLHVSIGGVELSPNEVESFVRDDGFKSVADFVSWRSTHRTLPFEGVLIRWEPL